MLEQTRIYTLMTLNQVATSLIRSLSADNPEGMNKSLQIIMQTTISMLQAESRTPKLGVMNEFLTAFFASVTE